MEAIELISKELRIPQRILKADINELAWNWEHTLAALEPPKSRPAIIILINLVRSYLRGKGYRLGNYQGARKHGMKSTLIFTAVTGHIIKGGNIRFPVLHSLGYDSWDHAIALLETVYDDDKVFNILDEAERILRETDEK